MEDNTSVPWLVDVGMIGLEVEVNTTPEELDVLLAGFCSSGIRVVVGCCVVAPVSGCVDVRVLSAFVDKTTDVVTDVDVVTAVEMVTEVETETEVEVAMVVDVV